MHPTYFIQDTTDQKTYQAHVSQLPPIKFNWFDTLLVTVIRMLRHLCILLLLYNDWFYSILFSFRFVCYIFVYPLCSILPLFLFIFLLCLVIVCRLSLLCPSHPSQRFNLYQQIHPVLTVVLEKIKKNAIMNNSFMHTIHINRTSSILLIH